MVNGLARKSHHRVAIVVSIIVVLIVALAVAAYFIIRTVRRNASSHPSGINKGGDSACPSGANGQVCSGLGTCVAGGSCVCNPGVTGSACDTYTKTCPYGTDPKDDLKKLCSGHGTCNQDGSCTCDAGWTNGPNGPCSAVRESCPVGPQNHTCSGIGTCVNGTCNCPSGFFGPACESTAASCPRAQCDQFTTSATCGVVDGCEWSGTACVVDTGAGGIERQGTAYGTVCSGHGTCTSQLSLTDPSVPPEVVCACDAGFFGPACGRTEPAQCSSWDGKECNGQGTCVAGQCVCNSDNFFGPVCQYDIGALWTQSPVDFIQPCGAFTSAAACAKDPWCNRFCVIETEEEGSTTRFKLKPLLCGTFLSIGEAQVQTDALLEERTTLCRAETSAGSCEAKTAADGSSKCQWSPVLGLCMDPQQPYTPFLSAAVIEGADVSGENTFDPSQWMPSLELRSSGVVTTKSYTDASAVCGGMAVYGSNLPDGWVNTLSLMYAPASQSPGATGCAAGGLSDAVENCEDITSQAGCDATISCAWTAPTAGGTASCAPQDVSDFSTWLTGKGTTLDDWCGELTAGGITTAEKALLCSDSKCAWVSDACVGACTASSESECETRPACTWLPNEGSGTCAPCSSIDVNVQCSELTTEGGCNGNRNCIWSSSTGVCSTACTSNCMASVLNTSPTVDARVDTVGYTYNATCMPSSGWGMPRNPMLSSFGVRDNYVGQCGPGCRGASKLSASEHQSQAGGWMGRFLENVAGWTDPKFTNSVPDDDDVAWYACCNGSGAWDGRRDDLTDPLFKVGGAQRVATWDRTCAHFTDAQGCGQTEGCTWVGAENGQLNFQSTASWTTRSLTAVLDTGFTSSDRSRGPQAVGVGTFAASGQGVCVPSTTGLSVGSGCSCLNLTQTVASGVVAGSDVSDWFQAWDYSAGAATVWHTYMVQPCTDGNFDTANSSSCANIVWKDVPTNKVSSSLLSAARDANPVVGNGLPLEQQNGFDLPMSEYARRIPGSTGAGRNSRRSNAPLTSWGATESYEGDLTVTETRSINGNSVTVSSATCTNPGRFPTLAALPDGDNKLARNDAQGMAKILDQGGTTIEACFNEASPCKGLVMSGLFQGLPCYGRGACNATNACGDCQCTNGQCGSSSFINQFEGCATCFDGATSVLRADVCKDGRDCEEGSSDYEEGVGVGPCMTLLTAVCPTIKRSNLCPGGYLPDGIHIAIPTPGDDSIVAGAEHCFWDFDTDECVAATTEVMNKPPWMASAPACEAFFGIWDGTTCHIPGDTDDPDPTYHDPDLPVAKCFCNPTKKTYDFTWACPFSSGEIAGNAFAASPCRCNTSLSEKWDVDSPLAGSAYCMPSSSNCCGQRSLSVQMEPSLQAVWSQSLSNPTLGGATSVWGAVGINPQASALNQGGGTVAGICSASSSYISSGGLDTAALPWSYDAVYKTCDMVNDTTTSTYPWNAAGLTADQARIARQTACIMQNSSAGMCVWDTESETCAGLDGALLWDQNAIVDDKIAPGSRCAKDATCNVEMCSLLDPLSCSNVLFSDISTSACELQDDQKTCQPYGLGTCTQIAGESACNANSECRWFDAGSGARCFPASQLRPASVMDKFCGTIQAGAPCAAEWGCKNITINNVTYCAAGAPIKTDFDTGAPTSEDPILEPCGGATGCNLKTQVLASTGVPTGTTTVPGTTCSTLSSGNLNVGHLLAPSSSSSRGGGLSTWEYAFLTRFGLFESTSSVAVSSIASSATTTSGLTGAVQSLNAGVNQPPTLLWGSINTCGAARDADTCVSTVTPDGLNTCGWNEAYGRCVHMPVARAMCSTCNRFGRWGGWNAPAGAVDMVCVGSEPLEGSAAHAVGDAQGSIQPGTCASTPLTNGFLGPWSTKWPHWFNITTGRAAADGVLPCVCAFTSGPQEGAMVPIITNSDGTVWSGLDADPDKGPSAPPVCRVNGRVVDASVAEPVEYSSCEVVDAPNDTSTAPRRGAVPQAWNESTANAAKHVWTTTAVTPTDVADVPLESSTSAYSVLSYTQWIERLQNATVAAATSGEAATTLPTRLATYTRANAGTTFYDAEGVPRSRAWMQTRLDAASPQLNLKTWLNPPRETFTSRQLVPGSDVTGLPVALYGCATCASNLGGAVSVEDAAVPLFSSSHGACSACANGGFLQGGACTSSPCVVSSGMTITGRSAASLSTGLASTQFVAKEYGLAPPSGQVPLSYNTNDSNPVVGLLWDCKALKTEYVCASASPYCAWDDISFTCGTNTNGKDGPLLQQDPFCYNMTSEVTCNALDRCTWTEALGGFCRTTDDSTVDAFRIPTATDAFGESIGGVAGSWLLNTTSGGENWLQTAYTVPRCMTCSDTMGWMLGSNMRVSNSGKFGGGGAGTGNVADKAQFASVTGWSNGSWLSSGARTGPVDDTSVLISSFGYYNPDTSHSYVSMWNPSGGSRGQESRGFKNVSPHGQTNWLSNTALLEAWQLDAINTGGGSQTAGRTTSYPLFNWTQSPIGTNPKSTNVYAEPGWYGNPSTQDNRFRWMGIFSGSTPEDSSAGIASLDATNFDQGVPKSALPEHILTLSAYGAVATLAKLAPQGETWNQSVYTVGPLNAGNSPVSATYYGGDTPSDNDQNTPFTTVRRIWDASARVGVGKPLDVHVYDQTQTIPFDQPFG